MDPPADDNHEAHFGSSGAEMRGGTALLLREPLLIETSVHSSLLPPSSSLSSHETRRFHCYIKIILSLCLITYVFIIGSSSSSNSKTRSDSTGDPRKGEWDHRLAKQRWKDSNGTDDGDDVSHVQLRSNYDEPPPYNIIQNHILRELTYGEEYNDTIRIRLELIKTTKDWTNIHPHGNMKCPLGKIEYRSELTGEIRDGELPSILLQPWHRDYPYDIHILDFTAYIETDLKILFIGDSVMLQLGEAFNQMVHERRDNKERNHIVAPTKGGGVAAIWRMTGLLSKSMQGKLPIKLANHPGGGWSKKDIAKLLNHEYQNTTVGRFDTVIYRVMHGWMPSKDITHARLVEAVELAHELLGAETVILMTIPFTNNVNTFEEMNKVNNINNDIREIARGWHLRNSTGVKHVLVLELGTYYNHIIWINARSMGYNVSSPLKMTNEMFDMEGKTFLFDKLETGKEWPPSIAMVCSDPLKSWIGKGKAKCNRNYLFLDGMHICPETLAARYGIAVACLLGCVYNRKSGADGLQRPHEIKLRACELECNEQFMSVMPLHKSYFYGSEREFASFAG